MVQPKTDKSIFDAVVAFTEAICMAPLPFLKEKEGCLLSLMLIPLLFSALDLFANAISDPETIDKAWTIGAGSPKGPFRILDTVGFLTAPNIVSKYARIPFFSCNEQNITC